jgi:hypothetical protein
MRKIVVFAIMVFLGFVQGIRAQNPLIKNLGSSTGYDRLMRYVYNQSDSKFYLSSQPNGHLYSIDPSSPGDSAHDCGNVRQYAQLPTAETFIWALCYDASTGNKTKRLSRNRAKRCLQRRPFCIAIKQTAVAIPAINN